MNQRLLAVGIGMLGILLILFAVYNGGGPAHLFKDTFAAVALFMAAGLSLWLRRWFAQRCHQPQSWRKAASASALPATPGMTADSLKDQREAIALLEQAMRSAGVFRQETIAPFIARLLETIVPFGRLDTAAGYESDDVLTLAEKRALGLNARMKYTRGLIDMFSPEALAGIEPRSYMAGLHGQVYNKVRRRRDLSEFKDVGIKRVRILPCGDARDCPKIAHCRKVHPIDAAPDLPIEGCTAAHCRCLYVAVFEYE